MTISLSCLPYLLFHLYLYFTGFSFHSLFIAARHVPPSCPSDAQICQNCANVALLSWVPVQDVVKSSPLGYVVERQEVGSQEWLQCLTTDGATSAEVRGDNVPREADYRFRVCSTNKYGRSSHVEFPSSVHLGEEKAPMRILL